MGNRLADSASTYLRQHADNPVDWWPWCAEAFAEAARRDVPVLLSVGYAACHWCHVMAHESFENTDTARQINDGFVPVKVDREERPDVDAVYMTATQVFTGQGGWPMTCFLTPDGRPFYAGTYFPPRASSGLPAFPDLLSAISQAWQGDRDAVVQSAGRIAEALTEIGAQPAPGRWDADTLDAVAERVEGEFDARNGGFGGAPKFPPTMVLEFLLRQHERNGSPALLDAVSQTLEHMARGGIYDQIGGGFCRYSVDDHWHVPHFEKMLDDNAQLLRVYAHHWRLTGSALSGRIAAEIGEFLIRDMLLPSGGFAAALDADTGGVEGATYLFGPDELTDVLGPQDGPLAASMFGLTAPPPVPGGGPGSDLAPRVLRLPADPPDGAAYVRIRQRLLDARNRRPQPLRDSIVVTASNGLVIAALAEAGAVFGRDDWITVADGAAAHLLAVHAADRRYRHSAREGVVGPGPATLADHADAASGLLALYQVTGAVRWLSAAIELIDSALAAFGDPSGGYFDVAESADGPQIVRPKDPTDGAAPSGASALTHALLTAAALTGRGDYRDRAEELSEAASGLAQRFPRAAGWHLAAAETLLSGPVQVAVSGPASADRDRLAAAARLHAPGGSVVDVGEPDAAGRPLLMGRPGIDGGPAAYLCRGFVCDRPVVTDTELIPMLLTSVRVKSAYRSG